MGKGVFAPFPPALWAVARMRQKLPLARLQERDVQQNARHALVPRQSYSADRLEVDLLRHLQRVIDLDAKISDRALELPVSE